MNRSTDRSAAGIASVCAGLCTAFLAFWTPLPTVADEHLALPIARAVADPTLYPATDLLVSSGLRGPFHLYRLAGSLYAHGLNVDAWWYALLIVSLVTTFVAAWYLAQHITGSSTLAAVVTATLAAASPYRGSLHWFLFPSPNLVTSTLAAPAVMAAVVFVVRGRAGIGLIIAALTFNLHPALGLVTAAAIAVTMLADRDMPRRTMLRWWAGAFACAAPNALFVALAAPRNFAVAPGSGLLSFADQFRLYADHAYIADHWRENYGWFLLQLGGMLWFRQRFAATSRHALHLAGAFLCVAIIWFANLYSVNYPAVTLTFAVRGVAFVKPIAFAVVAASLHAWATLRTGRARLTRLIPVVLLLIAALHKNLDIGEGMAAVAWGAIVLLENGSPRRILALLGLALIVTGTVEVLGQGWRVFGVAPFTSGAVDAARLATIVAAAGFLVAAAFFAPTPDAIAIAGERPASTGIASRWRGAMTAVSACAAVLVFALVLRGQRSRLFPTTPSGIARAMRLAAPDPAVAGLTTWAPRGSAAGSLFALPPVDRRFGAFRLAAGRGVFAALADVNQLAYDAAQYGAAHARLVAQGMRVTARHQFDGSAWDTLGTAGIRALAGAGVDYAVFNAGPRTEHPLGLPVVYRDSLWIVYDVRSAR